MKALVMTHIQLASTSMKPTKGAMQPAGVKKDSGTVRAANGLDQSFGDEPFGHPSSKNLEVRPVEGSLLKRNF
jgi:hypothetical protein